MITTLPTSANILSASAEIADFEGNHGSLFLITTADRRLNVLDANTKALKASHTGLQDSPILSTQVVRQRHLLTASMSGQLTVSDVEGKVMEKRRDHSKYIVKVAVYDDGQTPLVATAGWDCKVVIYRPSSGGDSFKLGEPTATITLATKPEAMLFMRHPESSEPILLLSRTDSNFLYYYTCEDKPRLLGRQNLAPHSNAWVAFTPSALALCPTDPTLIAVGTSTVPHMKLLIVRLLIPSYDQDATITQPSLPVRASLLDDTPVQETQASQSRRELAIADREFAAILIHCTTMAPQTAYSTPAVAWRPDGSGVWVNGDDGAVRGVEKSSGKVLCTMREGHEPGSKVRCLWAGMVGEEEVMVSGGFDRRAVVWKVM